MAFSLGTIFVDLKVNTAQFLDGMTKASAYATKTGRDIEKGLGKIGEILSPLGEVGERLAAILDGVGNSAFQAFSSVGKIGGSLGILAAGAGGVTALGGAMFALADHASEVGAKIFEASEKTGIGAAQMSGLMAIAKETGGNFESLTTSLARAGANLEKAIIAPGAESGKILAQVMGGAKNLSDLGLKPMGDRLQIVMQRIFAMNDTGERNAALSALLGRGWMENVSALKLLAEQGYGPAIEQAKKFGVFFDSNAAAKAKQFQIGLATMKAEISSLGLAVGQSAVPVLTRLMGMLEGMGRSAAATGHAYAAMMLASVGAFGAAKEQWREYQEAAKADTQAQTDFLVHLQNLAAGEKATEGQTKNLTGAFKEHRGVLADIIQRERDEIAALDIHNNKAREAREEYQRTLREIQKAAAAGGDYAESLRAQALAADVFAKKLMQIPAVLPKLPGWGTIARAGNGAAPGLSLGGADTSGLGTLPGALPAVQTINDLAPLRTGLDSTKGYFRDLRLEEELSGASLGKLAQRFSGLTTYQIAATAEGRRMIEMLSQMDKTGSTLAEHFAELQNHLIVEGADLGGKMVNVLGGSIEQLEDAFAKLAVTGKASFKQIYTGVGEQVMKAGLQKGVSVLLGGLHLGGGIKRTGNTAQEALYVTPVSDSGKALGGLLGAGHGLSGAGEVPATPPAGGADMGGFAQKLSREFSSLFGGLSSDLSKVFQAFGGIGKGISSLFGNIFGGLLAEGGDVTPGKAYMVGERHPEWFVPGRPGQIVPSMSVQQLRPLVYSPTYHINTPDADSFRRSHAQILSDGYRTMALTHARNG